MTILKNIAAALVIILGGLFGVVFFFADASSTQDVIIRFLVVIIYYLIISSLVASLLYPRWKLSLLVSWSVVIIFFLNLQTSLSEGLNSIFSNVSMLVVPIIVSFLGGYLVNLYRNKNSNIEKKSTD